MLNLTYISGLHLSKNLCKAGARQPACVRNSFLEDYQRNDEQPNPRARNTNSTTQTKLDDADPPPYETVLEGLEQETRRFAIQKGSQDVTASAMAYSKSGIHVYRELIVVMVVGGHGFLGPRAGDEQEWSID